MKYPFVIWQDGPAEVIASGPGRYRLFWRGTYVGRFVQDWMAILYARREFLPISES